MQEILVYVLLKSLPAVNGEVTETHMKKTKAFLALICKETSRTERGILEGVRKPIPKMECKKRLILSCLNHDILESIHRTLLCHRLLPK